MRKKALFFPVLAALMLAGCSNDEISEAVPDTPDVFTGDEAYMSVKLADVGSITSRGSNGGFQYGDESEHSVNTAHFYFYDKDGLFVAEGSTWNGGNAVTTSENGNIEFKSNTVVVLKGLTQKNYPKHMVTVLNKPGDFTPGQTLDEMEKTLSYEDGVGIWNTVDDTNYFTMSTTSYEHSDSSPYFVTEVKEENFSLEPIDADNIQSPVTVYVERLAAKVTVKSDGLKADENGRYKITTTVAGNENVGTDGNPAAEELYVELLGWKLNATAKHSNMMKNIDEEWNDYIGSKPNGFTWNDANNFRSYWGKSYNYGLANANGTYPDKFTEITTTDFLNYVNLTNPVELGKFSYCAENTNTSKIVSDYFPSAVTSVLLSAKVCDKNGNGLDLVRYNGTLFTKEAFFNYILNVLNTSGKLDYWTTTDNNNYTQIDNKFVEWENVGDGVIKVVFKKPSNVETIYKKDDNSYSAVTDFTELDKALEEAATDAIGYNGGLMYYNIPIEHLNNDEISETDGNKTIPEAKYGVVRNHHYVVTINKLENMGHGIFDSNEAIVPGDDDKETYYVGANINILSWKIVSQNVEL